MAINYYELRTNSVRGTDSVAADVMRHLHARESLGKTAVITDQPVAFLAAARKQWLRIIRVVQKQRACTLNADKILKYTHTITRMQQMHFSIKSPLDQPDADIYFMDPDSLEIMPPRCWTTYTLATIQRQNAEHMLVQLPMEALIVDYMHAPLWHSLGLHPKQALEDQVIAEWRQVQQFMQSYKIDTEMLVVDGIHNIENMDEALDTLLGVNRKFLQVTHDFQRSLELARPLRLQKAVREQYDVVALLAHRVQVLSPGSFSSHILPNYNKDDSFFLSYLHPGETLATAFHRLIDMGYPNIAKAVYNVASMPNAGAHKRRPLAQLRRRR